MISFEDRLYTQRQDSLHRLIARHEVVAPAPDLGRDRRTAHWRAHIATLSTTPRVTRGPRPPWVAP